jgi:hypothetical protein
MDADQVAKQIHCLQYTSGINQRYHQRLEWWWGFADKVIRISVGVLAVFGLWASMNGPGSADTAEALAVGSLALAVALNVIPSAEREKFHGELFHRWSDLRRSAELLKVRLDDPKTTVAGVRERILEMTDHENTLHGCEPAPWRWLLELCQGDENEAEYGPGIRTHQQVEAEKKRLIASFICSDVAAESTAASA